MQYTGGQRLQFWVTGACDHRGLALTITHSFAFSIYLPWHHLSASKYSQEFLTVRRKPSLNFYIWYFSWTRQLKNSKISVAWYKKACFWLVSEYSGGLCEGSLHHAVIQASRFLSSPGSALLSSESLPSSPFCCSVEEDKMGNTQWTVLCPRTV